VTWKGQGRDPDTFGANYLENGWRDSVTYNRAPIGNGTWGIKWSRDRPMTSHDPERSRS